MSKSNELRREKILSLLNQENRCSVKSLSEQFHVSTETIRKDLYALERRGKVIKRHGYVTRNEVYNELPIDVKVEENTDLKNRISYKAVQVIPDHSTIYIDPGSTTLSMVHYLPLKKSCTIVTPSLRIAQSLLSLKHEILLIGGLVQKKGSTTTGAFALENLKHVQLDIAFMGTDGFFGCEGPTTFSFQELSVKQKVMEQAHKKVLLCDISKFHKTGTYPYARFSEYDLLITNPLTAKEKELIASVKHIETV